MNFIKAFESSGGFLPGRVWGKSPGTSALGKSISRRFQPQGPFLVEAQGNKICTVADEIGISVLTDGIWEAWETELFKKVVKEGMVLVDIGAHVGYYTLIGPRLVGNNGVVYGFEPDPGNYELLCKNINMNGSTNIIPVQKAVSNKCGKVRSWLCKVDSINHSLIRANVLRKSGFIEVETVTLDAFLETTTGNTKEDIIVKIDTGGEGKDL